MTTLNKLWQNFLGSLPTIVGVVVALVFLGVFALIIVIFLGYLQQWPWTGFNEYVRRQPLLPNQPYSPGKTLWDWLQLLFIPGVLAIGGYLLNQTADRHQQTTTDENTRDTALQAYLDKMSDLLLTHHLRTSKDPEAEVRKIARARTLAVLRGLDPARKAGLLLYLFESGLIEKNDCIIDLKQADFSKADLRVAYLSNDPLNGRPTKVSKSWLSNPDLAADLHSVKLSKTILIEANFSSANLSNADLSHTYLRQADLRKAVLRGADLCGADLKEADLQGAIGITNEELEKQTKSLKGATMPDGSKHP